MCGVRRKVPVVAVVVLCNARRAQVFGETARPGPAPFWAALTSTLTHAAGAA